MSSTLTWEPQHREKDSLPDELKFVLRKQCSDGYVDIRMSESDLAYLRGLRDAGVKGAQTLIEAIEKYESIIVREEY